MTQNQIQNFEVDLLIISIQPALNMSYWRVRLIYTSPEKTLYIFIDIL